MSTTEPTREIPMQEVMAGIPNLICFSDTHIACRGGLCHPDPFSIDGGGTYTPSEPQQMLYRAWHKFWHEWVPFVTKKEPFAVLANGDLFDGVHHGSKTQVSQNYADQEKMALTLLEPIVEACNGQFYVTRGTEAHVGKSGEFEEMLAKKLGAIPDEHGHYSRFELFARVGDGLVHALHHIGTTGSSHYESTAVMKELTESFTESGRWGDSPPDIVVRSHRHRLLEVRIPTKLGYGIAFVTAGWQLKTPFTYKIPGGRLTTPQIGGSLIRFARGELFTRHKIWRMERPKIVAL